MTDIFLFLHLHPHWKLIQNGRNLWYNFDFHRAWLKQLTVSVEWPNSLNSSLPLPQAEKVSAWWICYYIPYIYSIERGTKSLVVLIFHYIPFLYVALSYRGSQNTYTGTSKEGKQAKYTQPQKKALSLGIHFLCNSSIAPHCWPSEHTAKHNCLYNLCMMSNVLCWILLYSTTALNADN